MQDVQNSTREACCWHSAGSRVLLSTCSLIAYKLQQLVRLERAPVVWKRLPLFCVAVCRDPQLLPSARDGRPDDVVLGGPQVAGPEGCGPSKMGST